MNDSEYNSLCCNTCQRPFSEMISVTLIVNLKSDSDFRGIRCGQCERDDRINMIVDQ